VGLELVLALEELSATGAHVGGIGSHVLVSHVSPYAARVRHDDAAEEAGARAVGARPGHLRAHEVVQVGRAFCCERRKRERGRYFSDLVFSLKTDLKQDRR